MVSEGLSAPDVPGLCTAPPAPKSDDGISKRPPHSSCHCGSPGNVLSLPALSVTCSVLCASGLPTAPEEGREADLDDVLCFL